MSQTPWTPEPWKARTATYRSSMSGKHLVLNPQRHYFALFRNQEDRDRTVACVNGCAGLNPTAYREVIKTTQQFLRTLNLVQAQFQSLTGQPLTITGKAYVELALAHATEQPLD